MTKRRSLTTTFDQGLESVNRYHLHILRLASGSTGPFQMTTVPFDFQDVLPTSNYDNLTADHWRTCFGSSKLGSSQTNPQVDKGF